MRQLTLMQAAVKLTTINNDQTSSLQLADQLAKHSSTGGCVLAFDFGEKRIGVATGEHQLVIAHPLMTIDSEANDERFRIIAELIQEWQPALLVVGLPLSLDGEEHALTALSKKFARRLDGRFNLPVVMVDERLTSVEANQTLKQSGITGRKQKPMLDQVA